jgi:dihydrofolate reductase
MTTRGRTQYYTATTLDGFLADAQHSLDWLFEVHGDTDHAEDFAAFFGGVGALAMGSTTYQWVLDHEKVLDDPAKWRASFGDTPAWVFTHRDLTAVPGANLFLTAEDVAEVHAHMVQAAGGKNIWLVGGGDLVGQFADLGLVDEVLLSVAPVTLGSGAPLLPRRLLAADLRLESVDRNGQFALLRYSLPQGGRRVGVG